MKRNSLRERLHNGQICIGTQLRFGSPAIAEMAGLAGFDFVVIDGEHAPQSPPGILAQLQALGNSSCTPIVRLGRNDPDDIRLMLDIGSGGVLIPMVRTAEEARQATEATRLPPAGKRSLGPSRAHDYGFRDGYHIWADETVLCMIMIETAEAVASIEEIAGIEALDGVFIGPGDLSMSLGFPMQFRHPKVEGAVERVLEACRHHNKPVGLDLDVTDLSRMQGLIGRGVRMLVAEGDEWILKAAFDELRAVASGVVGEARLAIDSPDSE